ncbi:hypothetical protein B0H67DRAFT_632192 [Lasiosphaeris hirsuta]|uniref:DUF7029 domain-containing protein n=1 Tax=Lasiosphaeris hirsuta TaxID=260670 RepID=A0AA40AZ30_9PEZI|nr:hypothetical protein B0H67DRAFT_632192 [Lasiosphaeris hirsuta]
MRFHSISALLGLAAVAVHGLPASGGLDVTNSEGGCSHCFAPTSAYEEAEAKATASSTIKYDGPVETLEPAVHWDFDTKPASNVVPIPVGRGSELYYGISAPSKAGNFAFLTHFFTKPSVNIDHSAQIQGVEYTEERLVVTFLTQKAFNMAASTWLSEEALILIAYVDSCGNYAEGERCFVEVKTSDLTFKAEELVVIASGKSRQPEEISLGGETNWGQWIPHRSPGSARRPSTTASAGYDHDVKKYFSWGSNSVPSSTATSSVPSASPGAGHELACTAPVDDAKYGLPTACLGDDFDADLDRGLGWMSVPYEFIRFIKALVTEVDDTGKPSRRDLDTRCWPSFLCKIRDALVEAGKTIIDAIKSATTISGSVQGDIKWQIPDPAKLNSGTNQLQDPNTRQVVSPWGDAILIKASATEEGNKVKAHLNVFCVGCGVSGAAHIAGSMKWSLLDGFNLPGLSWGVVTIGLSIGVDAEVHLEAAARGKLLIGAEMGLQGAEINYDIVDSSKSGSKNWTPYFTPVLEAEGELLLSAGLSLPVGLKIEVQIGTFSKGIGFVDEPSIRGVAQFAGSVEMSSNGTFSSSFQDDCMGTNCQLSWRNQLYTLFDTGEKDIARKCIGLPPTPPSTPTHPRPTPQTHQPLGTPTPPPPFPPHHHHHNKTTTLAKVLDITPKIKHTKTSDVATYPPPSFPSRPYTDTPTGLTYTQLTSTSGRSAIISCANGNIYSVLRSNAATNGDCSGTWTAGAGRMLVGDGAGRGMHYYGDEMAAAGGGRGEYYYVAVDPMGRFFYPVLCHFEGAAGMGSKVLVVKDLEAGVAVLESGDVMYSVTGGQVTRCGPVWLRLADFGDEDGFAGVGKSGEGETWELEDGWYEGEEQSS